MKKSQKQAIAVGAGVAAIAAAAAGVYMLTGKNSKNRKKVAKWVGDLQDDVLKNLEKTTKASKDSYNKVVDAAVKNYKGLKNVSAPELAAVAAELKGHWDVISKELSATSDVVKKAMPKTVKTISKKVSAAKKSVTKAITKKTAAPKKKAAVKSPAKRRR